MEGRDYFIKVLFLTMGAKAVPKSDSETLDMDTTVKVIVLPLMLSVP